jgi:hypothetical protein
MFVRWLTIRCSTAVRSIASRPVEKEKKKECVSLGSNRAQQKKEDRHRNCVKITKRTTTTRTPSFQSQLVSPLLSLFILISACRC